MSIERFNERSGAGVLVFRDKMWVIAGEENLEWKSDVWSSVDGKEWVLETDAPGFCGRYNHRVIEFQDRLWVLGGKDENFRDLRDLWTSRDGIHWVEVKIENRSFNTPISLSYVFANKLWLAFGDGGDLWSTEDGVAWQIESRRYHYPDGAKDIVECDKKLWLFSKDKLENSNRVWSSEDGLHWDLIELDTREITEKRDINVLLHNDEIWVFTYSLLEDRAWLYTSKNGKNWQKKSGSIYFGDIDVEDAYLVVFDNELFVVGGGRKISLDDERKWTDNPNLNWVEQAPDGFYSDLKFA